MKIILIVLAFVILFSSQVQGRDLAALWPEGWSKEESLGYFSIFSQRYSSAYSQEEDVLYVLGIRGERGHMHLILLPAMFNGQLEKGNPLVINKPAYFVNYPLLLTGGNGLKHILWLEEEGQDRQLRYVILDAENELFQKEKVIWETPRRMANLRGTLGKDGSVHLIWTGRGETGLEVFYCQLDPAGNMRISPEPLTESERFSSRGQIFVDSQGHVHFYWIEIGQQFVLLNFQLFDAEMNPLTEQKRVLNLSALNPLGNPEVDSDITGVMDEDDRVHMVWSGDYFLNGFTEPGSDIMYGFIENGELISEPLRITRGWRNHIRPSVMGHENLLYLVWEDSTREPTRIYHSALNVEDKQFSRPEILNVGTVAGFYPQVHVDEAGHVYSLWFKFLQDSRMLSISLLNTRLPAVMPFWYVLGVADDEPVKSLVFILGLNMAMTIINGASQLHFLALAILLIVLLRGRVNLDNYPYLLPLAAFSFILLLQETGFFLQPQYGAHGIEIPAAILASVFSIVFVRSFKNWSGLNDIIGQIALIGLFIYWYSFFIYIPHYIMVSIP